MEEKHFREWIEVKEKIHNTGRLPDIKEGQVWWCAMGENVGIEINGKNKVFSRPILVYKKLSKCGFMGIPLTSRSHEGSWYVPFRFKGRQQFAVLAQARVVSVSRLYEKMGTLSKGDFSKVKEGFKTLYL